MPPIQFLVDKRDSGQTIASLLRRRFRLTWSQAKRIVEGGHVRVAGQTTRAPDQRVRNANRVWIAAGVIDSKSIPPRPAGEPQIDAGPSPRLVKRTAPSASKKSTAGDGNETASRTDAKRAAAPANPPKVRSDVPTDPIEIVYSDNSVVVVNKPAGLTTSRSREDREDFDARERRFLPKTLAELLPGLLGIPDRPVRAVHRLDRDTTGLLVFARSLKSAADLTEQFRKHKVDRRYIALTRGVPDDRRIESILVPDRGDGRRGSMDASLAGEDGRRAVTVVSVLERFQGYALVACRLETGRTHQVRIHLGEQGHPLCGEKMYDRSPAGQRYPDDSGAERTMLHAVRLGFCHPETGETMTWEVDPPDDFRNLLRGLRAGEPVDQGQASQASHLSQGSLPKKKA